MRHHGGGGHDASMKGTQILKKCVCVGVEGFFRLRRRFSKQNLVLLLDTEHGLSVPRV